MLELLVPAHTVFNCFVKIRSHFFFMVIFMPYIKKRNSVFHTRHESVNTLECSVRTPAGVTAQAAEDISDTGAIKESRDVGSCDNLFFFLF